MIEPLPLSLSLAGLQDDGPGVSGPRERIAWARKLGFTAIQLDLTAPGMRPRQLDRSARRDLAALLNRSQLTLSGFDLWIPPTHFTSPAHQDRAVQAVQQALDLAADLTARPSTNPMTISLSLPSPCDDQILRALGSLAQHQGIVLADHAWSMRDELIEGIEPGIDPALILIKGDDPIKTLFAFDNPPASARLSDACDSGRITLDDQQAQLDLQLYAATLTTISYTRPVVLDVRMVSNPAHAAKVGLTAWQQCNHWPA